VEPWRIRHHFVRDPGDAGKIRADIAFGIYQRGEFFGHAKPVVFQDTDLGDPSFAEFELTSAGLNVNNGEHPRKSKCYGGEVEKML
jgi:hypothetical protein